MEDHQGISLSCRRCHKIILRGGLKLKIECCMPGRQAGMHMHFPHTRL